MRSIFPRAYKDFLIAVSELFSSLDTALSQNNEVISFNPRLRRGTKIEMINSFFAILSAAYIFGIFFFADSNLVRQINVLNPMSILHIPLYGILTILLVLALQAGQMNHSKRGYIIASLVAMAVAALDEFCQSFIPSREASITDILLDVIGICLGVLFSWRILLLRRPGFFIKRKER